MRRRAPVRDTKTGHERWLVSYADFITLLFAFFVVMYAVSQVNEHKYQTLSETLASVFDGKVPVERELAEWAQQFPRDQYPQISSGLPGQHLADTRLLANDLSQALGQLVKTGWVNLNATEEWVQIELNANLLFASASAAPSEEAQEVFAQIAEILAPYDNAIEVSGHTDDVPIHTSQYASNWELSAARAASVVRLLGRGGVAPERMAAVGYGEFRPVADNATEAGRSQNRRVLLMVSKTPVLRAATPMEQLAEQLGAPFEVGFPLEVSELSASSEANISAPLEVNISTVDNSLVPVRLQSGGLLFSRDPDQPRK